MYTAIGVGKVSLKIEAIMTKEPYEGNSIICTKTQPEVMEKLNLPRKVVSSNKNYNIYIN